MVFLRRRAVTPKDQKTQAAYQKLRDFAAYILLTLFGFGFIVNILDDLFFGNRIQGGVDPLMYGLIGSLIMLIFAGKIFNGTK